MAWVAARALFLAAMMTLLPASRACALEGGSQGLGWCPICGADRPLSHDFTHGRNRRNDGGGLTDAQRRYYQAHPLNEQGRVLYAQKDYAGALALFQQAHALYPEDPAFERNVRLAREAIANEQKYREDLRRTEQKRQEDLRRNEEKYRADLRRWQQQEGLKALEWEHLAGEYRKELSYETQLADAYEFAVTSLRERAERMEQEWPKLETAERHVRTLAGERQRAAAGVWRAYLEELERLRRTGALPPPLEKTLVPEVYDYGSEEAGKWIRLRQNRLKRPPAAGSRGLDVYWPRRLEIQDQLERMRPAPLPPRAAFARAYAVDPLHEASLEKLKKGAEETKARAGRAWAVQEELRALLNAQIRRKNALLDQYQPAADRAQQADRRVRYFADRLAQSAKEWAREEIKGAIARQAGEELRRRAPRLAEQAEAAKELVDDLAQRYAPALEALNAIGSHVNTMREQTHKWEGFFGELRVVIAGRFDPARCDALAEKLDANHRDLFRQAAQNAGASEELAKTLEFLLNYDLRNVFKQR